MEISNDVRQKMEQHEWFHAVDIGGGVVTSGRFPPDKPQNQTLFSAFDFLNHINVKGMDCLDIGATDGLMSFGLEKRGARSVVATDRVSGDGFSSLHSLLNSSVEQVVPVEISNIHEKLDGRYFDLIVCAGVIYHMLNPMSAIMACRSMLRPGGLLIVETAMSWASELPVLLLNSEQQEHMESSTYWMPTPSALKGMVRLNHFDVLGGRWMPDPGRGAVLGRAVAHTEQVSGANSLVKGMHSEGLLDVPYQELLRKADAQEPSRIAFTGKAEEFTIDPHSYVPNFPLHAHRPDPTVAIGRRDWKVVSR